MGLLEVTTEPFHLAANLTDLLSTNASTTGNSSLEPMDVVSYELPIWRKVMWCALFASVVIVATGGNLIVIWIVLANKRMRTVTNYFLVNLSIADAMVATLNIPFNYIYMLNWHWPFGATYCKITQFVAVLSICASVFTLMAISIDRYMAIINPLQPRMGKRTTLMIAGSIWVTGSVMSLPYFVVFHVIDMEGGRQLCVPSWPDVAGPESLYDYVYNVILMVTTYFLPMGAMTYTYSRVGVELWGSQSIGECTQRQMENIRSKRRVVKMMIVVVLIFGLCWLPTHVYFIVVAYFPDLGLHYWVQEMYLGIYWLAMSNTMVNPIIYCWMNAKFRRGFKQFFSCCPCVHVAPESILSRQDVVTSRYSYSGSPEAQCRIIRNDSLDTDDESLYNDKEEAIVELVDLNDKCEKSAGV